MLTKTAIIKVKFHIYIRKLAVFCFVATPLFLIEEALRAYERTRSLMETQYL